MKTHLGKKQNVSNDMWHVINSNIEDYVTREELTLLIEKTQAAIIEQVNNKKAAYAWSGGKDSIVLGHICRGLGILDCMLGRCNLEYPAFLKWIEAHQPPHLEIINTEQDLDWLSKHEALLFPTNSKQAAIWFAKVQHTAQQIYYKKHQLDMILLGRRKADGNFVGKNGYIYTDAKGITRYSPLAEWRHEHILAYIHYYNLEVPPIYNWPNGYKCGTHPWPARQHTKNVMQAWNEIYQIDKQIVEQAAEKILSAKMFMEGLENEDRKH